MVHENQTSVVIPDDLPIAFDKQIKLIYYMVCKKKILNKCIFFFLNTKLEITKRFVALQNLLKIPIKQYRRYHAI